MSKSEALKALTEGGWKESGEKEIVWKEWDENTVDRFLQWTYTGDYKFRLPTLGTTLEENGSVCFDYQPALLASAKVYAMANYFLLPELKNLAIQRLQETLGLVGWPAPESTMVALIEYVYAHTDGQIGEEEPLRKLVTTFAASNYANLQGPQFRTLMSDGGDFVVDLVAILTQRISEPNDFQTGEDPNVPDPFDIGRTSKKKKKERPIFDFPHP